MKYRNPILVLFTALLSVRYSVHFILLTFKRMINEYVRKTIQSRVRFIQVINYNILNKLINCFVFKLKTLRQLFIFTITSLTIL